MKEEFKQANFLISYKFTFWWSNFNSLLGKQVSIFG